MNKSISLGLLLTIFFVYAQLSVAVAAVYTEKPFENPAADAPTRVLPTDVTQLAQAVINATSLTGAIDAVEAVLAQGGVAVKNNKILLNHPIPPSAKAYVEAINLADIALEAQNRPAVATLTAQQLSRMLSDFGWPAQKGKSAEVSFMLFLKTWLQAALNNPDDPTRFAILFIAANNQLQAPKANLAWAYQSPDLVRFSRLELELLSAAFERALVTPASTKTISGPCAAVNRQFGKWNDTAAVVAGQLSGSALTTALSALYGPSTSGLNAKTSAALRAWSLAARTFKFTQLLRYGALSVQVNGDDVVTKPTLGQADIIGTLSAQVGLDQPTYAEYQAWANQSSAQAATNNKACLAYLGLPQTTLTDSVSDANNWRVDWSLGDGFDQVQWQNDPLSLELAGPLNADSATEASSSASYRVNQQQNETASPNTRERTAVFTAKLTPADSPTLWGQGVAGFIAASGNNSGFNNFATLMGVGTAGGLAAMLTDTVSQWALEVVSPKRKVRQKLKENKPKNWVGTIKIDYNKIEVTNSKTTVGDPPALEEEKHDLNDLGEVTIFQVNGGGDSQSTDMRSEAVVTTRCSSLSRFNSKRRTRDGGEGGWEPWSPDDILVNKSGYDVNSGDVKTGVQMLIYPKSYIDLMVKFITDPALRAYWLTKTDTWELNALAPTCKAPKGGMGDSMWKRSLYNWTTKSWEEVEGSNLHHYVYYDVNSSINARAGFPLLTGKLIQGKDPRIIDVTKIIKKTDMTVKDKGYWFERHELHKVTIHLSLVE